MLGEGVCLNVGFAKVSRISSFNVTCGLRLLPASTSSVTRKSEWPSLSRYYLCISCVPLRKGSWLGVDARWLPLLPSVFLFLFLLFRGYFSFPFFFVQLYTKCEFIKNRFYEKLTTYCNRQKIFGGDGNLLMFPPKQSLPILFFVFVR